MCGRIVQYSSKQRYATFFGIEGEKQGDLIPRYNITPSQAIWVARKAQDGGGLELVTLRWGLVPHWSKGPDSRYTMINVRADTVHEKPAYRDAFKRRRCLIPVDGFYEWHQEDGKQPYFIKRKDDEPMALAGLWEHWEGEGQASIESCTIIVTEANDLIERIHDRMPVILPKKEFAHWLDPAANPFPLRALFKPFPSLFIQMYPVSREVNSPKHDDESLIKPIAI